MYLRIPEVEQKWDTETAAQRWYSLKYLCFAANWSILLNVNTLVLEILLLVKFYQWVYPQTVKNTASCLVCSELTDILHLHWVLSRFLLSVLHYPCYLKCENPWATLKKRKEKRPPWKHPHPPRRWSWSALKDSFFITHIISCHSSDFLKQTWVACPCQIITVQPLWAREV